MALHRDTETPRASRQEADPLASLRARGLVDDPTEDWHPRPLRELPRPTEPIAPLISEMRE